MYLLDLQSYLFLAVLNSTKITEASPRPVYLNVLTNYDYYDSNLFILNLVS